MANKKTVKKSSKKPTKNATSTPRLSKQDKQNTRWRWFAITSLKLFFILLVTLTIYTIYLDGKVRHTFEGQRWQVPVQVFGQIEHLHIGMPLTLSNLNESLRINGYKKVSHANQPGQFEQSAHRIIIYRRAFDFGAGLEAATKLSIAVDKQIISELLIENMPVPQLILEPILLDRIVPDTKEDRVLVPLEVVPSQLIDTLLLIEDRDFYFHAGVSPIGIIRALFQNIKAGRTVQGGSTLTQQLVKNMFLTRHKTLWRKVNEALMALILEFRYSKDQLLEAYINEVYLGQHYANGIYGFGLAAKFYFGKSISQLSIEQMALLIAQIKGPSYYDPWRHPKRAKARRDLVLRLMFEQHLLSRNAFEMSVEAPLSIRKERRLAKQKYPAYLQLVKAELAKVLSDYEQQSGIRVFTGFSHRSQRHLEKVIEHQIPKLEQSSGVKQLQTAMIVTDINSAEIRALASSSERGYAGFNRALHAKRPIGSLIKPAIYLAALERYEQFNFATVLDDKPITLSSDQGKQWQPKNYDGKYRGQVPLIDGLVKSLNIPTVNLGMNLGLNNVANAMHLLGYQHDIVTRPSMLLGAVNMSPYEANQLFLPIANKGSYLQGHAITQIVSAKGETLWQFNQHTEQRLSTDAAYLLDYALTQVAQTGTAKSLTWRLKNKVIAGKTGTSNELRDSWFIGYDNKHLVTTWLGKDNNKPTALTGSSGALVLFAEFMKSQGIENKTHVKPASISMTLFEQASGNAVTEQCDNTVEYPAISRGITIQQTCLEIKPDKRSWFEKIFGE